MKIEYRRLRRVVSSHGTARKIVPKHMDVILVEQNEFENVFESATQRLRWLPPADFKSVVHFH